MKKNFRALWLLAKENYKLYSAALLCTVATVAIGFMTPLIFSETIDVVLSNGPSSMPAWAKAPVVALGGRDFIRQNYWIVPLILIAINVLNSFLSYYKEICTTRAGETVAKSLRDRIYRQLTYLPFAYHVRAETGDLIQRSTSDVETIRRFLSSQVIEAFRAVIMAIIAFTILFGRNTELAFFSMILIPVMFIASYTFFTVNTKNFKKTDESEGKMSAVLQENLTGVRVVRAFGMQQSEVEKFDGVSSDFKNKAFKQMKYLTAYWTSMDGVTLLQIMITLIACIVKAVAGEITVGTLIVFTSYISMLLYPLRQLGRILSEAGKSLVALGRITEIMEETAEGKAENEVTPPLNGDIVFDHVSFSYEDGTKILDDFCMTIPAGKTIALLGNTGSGKSTIVHLLQRLFAPDSGMITIGGVDIQTIERGYLRSHVGLMLQEPFLYGRTVMGNLAIAAPKKLETEIFEMSRVAHADGFIREFENGYATIIGERGVTLSGGQRQRVAIARTLLKDNSILVFDDSLSAVDMQTDRAIRDELKQNRDGVTTVIISHRINTLAEADRIFVLENGKLTAEGTHKELTGQTGLYQQIFAIQSALEDDLNKSRDAVAKEESKCKDTKK